MFVCKNRDHTVFCVWSQKTNKNFDAGKSPKFKSWTLFLAKSRLNKTMNLFLTRLSFVGLSSDKVVLKSLLD